MKKLSVTAASLILTVSLLAPAAMAKSPNSGHGQPEPKGIESHGQEKAQKPGKEEKAAHGPKATVTSDTYGHGHRGYIGLQRAFENVKDKPAGERIAELLATKYGITEMAELLKQQAADLALGIQAEAGALTETGDAAAQTTVTLTPEQVKAKKEELRTYAKELHEQIKKDLKALKQGDITLSDLADIYAASGSVTDAVYAQKDAVRANLGNLNAYKKLGQLYEQIGKTGVKAYVNGEEPEFDVPPVIKEGSTLVPFRAISEALKADVAWNQEEQSVTVTKDGTVVKLLLGSTTAYVDGKEVTLEVPGQLLNGRTVVPVRFISEAFEAKVDWEPETQSVVIVAEDAATTQ